MTLRKITCRFVAVLALAMAAFPASSARAATITPLSTFGTGGWLAPGDIPELDTSNSQRSLAVVPTTGNLVLVDRDSTLGNNAYVLSGTTGAVNGTLTPPTGGYSGGTFVVNGAGAASDGQIFVGNLVTSTASTFKVYGWASDSDFTTPATVAFSLPMSDASWGGVNRVGDVLTATGSGASAQWAAAGSNSAAGTNSTFSVGTTDASNTQATYTAVAGTATTSNGYRLGLSFVDSDTLIGTQGSTLYTTDFGGGTATATAGLLTGAAQRPVAYLQHAGVSYFATIDTNSSAVSIFDLSDPANPVSLITGNATSGTLTANANGTGGIGWGPQVAGNPNAYTLYAMSTNQGIQGFTVEFAPVPEPSTWVMLAMGGLTAGMAAVRRRRKTARAAG